MCSEWDSGIDFGAGKRPFRIKTEIGQVLPTSKYVVLFHVWNNIRWVLKHVNGVNCCSKAANGALWGSVSSLCPRILLLLMLILLMNLLGVIWFYPVCIGHAGLLPDWHFGVYPTGLRSFFFSGMWLWLHCSLLLVIGWYQWVKSDFYFIFLWDPKFVISYNCNLIRFEKGHGVCLKSRSCNVRTDKETTDSKSRLKSPACYSPTSAVLFELYWFTDQIKSICFYSVAKNEKRNPVYLQKLVSCEDCDSLRLRLCPLFPSSF